MIHNTQEFELLSAEVITTNGSSSVVVASRQFSEGQLMLRVSAKSGTTPYIDFQVQASDNDASTFHAHSYVPRIRDNGNFPIHRLDNLGNKLRLSWTVGGTSPSFTVTAILILKN